MRSSASITNWIERPAEQTGVSLRRVLATGIAVKLAGAA